MEVASILLGIGLSAAVGFRLFIPFLLMSIASRFGLMELSSGFDWLASTPALILLSTATVLEVGAYFIPFFDNLLDTIATPAAVVCGTIVMASTVVEMDPLIKWTMAVIAGGGAAGLIKGATATTRVASSTTTGGLGNPVVATVETGGSLVLTVLAIFIPIMAGVAAVLIIVYLIRKWRQFKKWRSGSA
ncbi:MAG: DUF4126 domain-containing protein [Cyclobacteriaceae bacterium]